MSLTAVTSGSQLSSVQNSYQQLRKEFTQLGQDLATGNLMQAQTDFVTLSQAAASQFGSNSPITQALNSIGQALQSGNLSAAQQAFASMSNGTPPNAVSSHAHHHHHGGGGFQQSLAQLGQALQSGNLSAAQQAFSALQQSWQAMSSSGAVTAQGTTAAANALSVDV